MKWLLTFLFLTETILAHAQSAPPAPSIIPQPDFLKLQSGQFTISKKTVIAVRHEEDRKSAQFLNNYLNEVYGFSLDIDKQEGSNFIRLNTKQFINAPRKDAYTLNVTDEGITIEGDTYAGTFHGIQTLIQLLPTTKPANGALPISKVTIQDQPRFDYRGMHLDVSRHFFKIDFVKKYIDYLALHKMNYFHWHLTDDQGWRIEIKQYPKLVAVGSWRDGTIIGRYPGIGNDNKYYGGNYTQEEIKEVIQYAADRRITVVPEIEMPGHASAAIAAYPWLSCFPEKETKIPVHPSEKSKEKTGKKVQETWGVFEDIFCAGKDSTFTFLQKVLDEVVAIFPSKYIHVGGDEAPKTHWKKCPACQARIKKEGLKDEHELQSYFIQRMEKYLNAKGRTLIGWDEILEGGLAPNAVVMSWRGEKGGIAAAKEGHQVIMTPGSHVYFDHTQTKNEDSVVIGGFSPLEKVFSYEPIPKELSVAEGKFVMGAQANLWTEYIKYQSKVEYMVFPRMSALSEVLWSPKEQRSWSHFESRLQDQFKRYDLWKANYSKAYFDLAATVSNLQGGVTWTLKNNAQKGVIVYSLPDGTMKMAKAGSVNISITKSGTYSAWISEPTPKRKPEHFNGYKKLTAPLTQKFTFNIATGKNVTITSSPNEKYPGQSGAFSLVNGVWSNKGLSYPDWLGWIGDDMEAVIDLGSAASFSKVRMHTLDQNTSWVYLPQYVEVSVSSDGRVFKPVGKSNTFVKDTLTMAFIDVLFPLQKARYVKVLAKNYGLIPDGKPGSGNKAWLFADELQVVR